MHKLGESFVEKVSDVRRRATVDGKAADPGESPEGSRWSPHGAKELHTTGVEQKAVCHMRQV
jgi:hypothetical protein